MPRRSCPLLGRTEPRLAIVPAIVLAVCGWLVAVGGGLASGATPLRVLPDGLLDSRPARWVTTGGRLVAFGAGREVRVAAGDATRSFDLRLDAPVSDGALAGNRLFLVRESPAAGLIELALDTPNRSPREHPLVPAPQGALRVALAGNVLALAERGLGVRLLRIVQADPTSPPHGSGHDPGHASGGVRLEPLGLVPLDGEPLDLVGAWPRFLVSVASRGVFEIALDSAPLSARRLSEDGSLHAMALLGREWVGLGADGLVEPGSTGESPHRVSGDDLAVAGRRLYVASPHGVRRYRDVTATGRTLPVIVANDFFQPDELTVDVGDTVQWENASGFHNVASCQIDRPGCDGAESSEFFYSGEPSFPFWVHSHTFAATGANPYLCDAHFSFMDGRITVVGPPPGPPVVSDGSPGQPLTARKLDVLGSRLEVAWDDAQCPGAADYQLVFGTGLQLPASPGGVFQLSGAACLIGPASPYVWTPPLPTPSGGLVWWIVLSTNGATREGSWGRDSAGHERRGPGPGGASGQCGIIGKDLTNPCAQP